MDVNIEIHCKHRNFSDLTIIAIIVTQRNSSCYIQTGKTLLLLEILSI